VGYISHGVSTLLSSARPTADFRHEALLYAGDDEFVEGCAAFVRNGVAHGEPVLVVVSAPKIRRLRAALGADADHVHFADMAAVGANPARIIPAWREFVDANRVAGRRFRGIGEPISADRCPAALVECQRHEDLLNVAFDKSAPWWLLCPYDVSALPAEVVEEAHRSHPFIMQGAAQRDSGAYRGLDAITSPYDVPLAPVPADAAEFGVDNSQLRTLRLAVGEAARLAGLTIERCGDFVYAVNEIASNSVRYGGGGGTMHLWMDDDALVCEVRDVGHITAPLVGRERPADEAGGGRGVWLANQLCDLVQVRSSPAGTVVRLHMSL
jgi:anti-sigma regulatory factor (Ser/Thr protein kinase)